MNPDQYGEWLRGMGSWRRQPVSPEERRAQEKANRGRSVAHQRAVERRRKRKRGGPK